MKRQLLAAWAVILAAAIGCGGDQPAGSGGDGKSGAKVYRIAVIPKGTSHQFWKSVHAGALQAAKELGQVEIIWKGPQTENDTAGQIEVVKNQVTKGVDGICLAPNHSESLIEAVQEANAAQIPVVIFDSGLGKGAKVVSHVSTDNYRGGQLAARRLAETLPQDRQTAILLRYRAGSESTEQREAGFLETLAKEFPAVKVLSSDQYGEATTQSAMDKALQLLLRHKDAGGIFAVCEPNCNGTLEALDQAGAAGKVKFVAFDPSDALIRGLQEGKVHGIILQDPVKMGYASVQAMVAHLRGQKPPQVVSTGEYVATPENMNSEQYRKLLNPILAE